MRDIDLFQAALGLVPPWMVVAANFDADKKRLDIEIDFKTGGRLPCPDCGRADCSVHDTVKKTWRHLDFFQHQARCWRGRQRAHFGSTGRDFALVKRLPCVSQTARPETVSVKQPVD